MRLTFLSFSPPPPPLKYFFTSTKPLNLTSNLLKLHCSKLVKRNHPPSSEYALPYPALPCPAPCPALPCPALPYLALPCPALPCPALPCPALPCPALPFPALACNALPCPALLCPIWLPYYSLPYPSWEEAQKADSVCSLADEDGHFIAYMYVWQWGRKYHREITVLDCGVYRV